LIDRIPVNLPEVTDADVESVARVMRSGWISGESPIVAEFEEKFAEFHGKKFGIAVPNGTLAIDLSVFALDLGPGDEVILPSFAIISCVSQILRSGATPIFVDADPVTWNMNVASLEQVVSKSTRAIMVVHTYGLPVDMDPVLEIASRLSIPVIEDAAEAHGLMYKSEVCGSMGYVSTFSFYANKNITTGEGGMILTDDEDFAIRLKYFRNLTFSSRKRFVHEALGWNLRFSGIQAAMGLSQLQRLNLTIEKRRRFAAIYREALEGVRGLEMAPDRTASGMNDYWVVGAVLDSDRWGSAGEFAMKLDERGIQTRPFFSHSINSPLTRKARFSNRSLFPLRKNWDDKGSIFRTV
jgi:perosamine synthetase